MTSASEAATRIPRDAHPVSRKNISDSALKVLSRLTSQGFQAYLVGGAVRDLLLGELPKDFDIATDATPEEVHGLFRNSRIIGRRFRIVHVRFGREIIEVTTFRGHHDIADDDAEDADDDQSGNRRAGNKKPASRQSDSGMLLRDNVYGSLEEDAARRDLTVNALYYSSSDFCVYDYLDGLRDLEQREIRIIGDADKRYREDPVRMLRVVRFAAKLDFSIAESTAAPIAGLAHMLEAVPAARLFDEILKLFMAGYALRTFQLLVKFELLEHLFPATAGELEESSRAIALIEAAMQSTDDRIAAGKPVTPAFILAALLWPPVVELRKSLEDNGMDTPEALAEAGQSLLMEQLHHIAIPRRFTAPMREIWDFQLRLVKRRGRGATKLLSHRRFRAAYDFLLLREQSGEDLDGLGKYWTELQEQHPDIQPDTSHDEDSAARPKRRRRRRKRPQ